MNDQRCANLACICEVAMLGDACSEYCTTVGAADPQAVRCHCGHDKCAQEMTQEMGEDVAPS